MLRPTSSHSLSLMVADAWMNISASGPTGTWRAQVASLATRTTASATLAGSPP